MEEMAYVEGGITIEAICAIVGAVIGAGGATYATGQVCGERLYYAGINSSKKWAKYKWYARVAAMAISPAIGGIFMVGLENKLYSMM